LLLLLLLLLLLDFICDPFPCVPLSSIIISFSFIDCLESVSIRNSAFSRLTAALAHQITTEDCAFDILNFFIDAYITSPKRYHDALLEMAHQIVTLMKVFTPKINDVCFLSREFVCFDVLFVYVIGLFYFLLTLTFLEALGAILHYLCGFSELQPCCPEAAHLPAKLQQRQGRSRADSDSQRVLQHLAPTDHFRRFGCFVSTSLIVQLVIYFLVLLKLSAIKSRSIAKVTDIERYETLALESPRRFRLEGIDWANRIQSRCTYLFSFWIILVVIPILHFPILLLAERKATSPRAELGIEEEKKKVLKDLKDVCDSFISILNCICINC
jgi:hypothetical protein